MKYLDKELHLIFNFIDRDSDGLISTNDFKQVIQELLPHTNQHGSLNKRFPLYILWSMLYGLCHM